MWQLHEREYKGVAHLMDEIFKRLRRFTDVDAMYLADFHPDSNQIHFRYCREKDEVLPPDGKTYFLAERHGPTATVIKTKQPVNTCTKPEHLKVHSRGVPFGDPAKRMQSAIHVPVFDPLDPSNVASVLAIMCEQPGKYSVGFEVLLKIIAHIVAHDLLRDRMDAIRQEADNRVQRERDRLVFAHRLEIELSAKMLLDLAKDACGEPDPAEARRKLEALIVFGEYTRDKLLNDLGAPTQPSAKSEVVQIATELQPVARALASVNREGRSPTIKEISRSLGRSERYVNNQILALKLSFRQEDLSKKTLIELLRKQGFANRTDDE